MNILDSGIEISRFNVAKRVFSSSQCKFFESKKGLSSNAARDKNVANKRLEESIQTISYLLDSSHNLREKELVGIFTAQTLQYIFENLLKNYKQYQIKNYNHDFRSTELARVMFETSAEYLKDAASTETVRNDLQRVSDHFKVQSESELRNESFAAHGNEPQRSLTQKEEFSLLEERRKMEEKFYALYKDPKVIELQSQHKKLLKGSHNLKSKIRRGKSKKQIIKFKSKLDDTEKEMLEIGKKLSEIEHNVLSKIEKIDNKLETKLNHLKPFYSRKKFLPEFLFDIVDEGYCVPEPDDGTKIIIEPSVDSYKSFHIPLDETPEDAIITDGMRKYFTSPAFHFLTIAKHDKIKWRVNEPGCSLRDLQKLQRIKNMKNSFIYTIIPASFEVVEGDTGENSGKVGRDYRYDFSRLGI